MTLYASFGNTLIYFGTICACVVAFAFIYTRITPGDELELFLGKEQPVSPVGISAVLAFIGACVGFTLPLLSLSLHAANLAELLMWALFAGCIQIGVHGIQYWSNRDAWKAMFERSTITPYALVCAGGSILVGLINAFSLVP